MKPSRIAPLLFLCSAILAAVSCDRKENSPGNAGGLFIRSFPAGATVSFRGAPYGNTPLEIKTLAPETYLLTIEKTGFSPRWVKIQVKPNQISRVKIHLEPLTASVLVTSNPSGAMVSVNGKERGPAPYILPDLEFGKYEIGVALPNHLPDSRPLIVPKNVSAPDSPFVMHFTLVSDSGSLRIGSNPDGADVFLDGTATSMGQTPFFLEKIKEGAHRVLIQKRGFKPVETTIAVVRNKEAAPSVFNLTPLPGSLVVKTTPADAHVELDGIPLNHPRKPCSLIPGVHRIRVSKRGYDDVALETHIRPEETTTELIEMNRNTGEIRFVANPPGVSISIDRRLVGMSQPDPERKNTAMEFLISGLSTGKHRLEFNHQRARRKEIRTFTIEAKGQTKTIPPIELWVPNANVEVLKTGRKYKNARIIEVAAGSNEILYEPEPGVRMSYRKEEVSVEHLPADDLTDKRFRTSSVNLLDLSAENPPPPPPPSSGTFLFNGLPAGTVVKLNGKEYGVSSGKQSPLKISGLPEGDYQIEVSHPYGKNPRDPARNSFRLKDPVHLENDTVKTFSPPPLWVAEYHVTLRNGKSYPACRIFDPGPDSSSVKLETAPGKAIQVKRSEIKQKKLLLKD